MFLTVPLLCWFRWRGFESKRVHEVQRRLTQILVMQRGPQIDHVSLLLATGAEALEDVVIEVHAEGAAMTVRAMDGAGATALRAAPCSFLVRLRWSSTRAIGSCALT